MESGTWYELICTYYYYNNKYKKKIISPVSKPGGIAYVFIAKLLSEFKRRCKEVVTYYLGTYLHIIF